MELNVMNPKHAGRFIEFLTGVVGTSVTFQLFDDKGADFTKARTFHGSLSDKDVIEWFGQKQAQGCGVYVTINETDGSDRRRRSNIKRYRVAAVDMDGTPLPETWPIQPDMIVETSPGKFHVYWLLVPGEDLNAWSDLQKQLAAYYGGDPVIIDSPRVLRLPGTLHLKGKPFLIRIVDEIPAFMREPKTIEQMKKKHPCEYDRPIAYKDRGCSEEPINGWDNDADIEQARAYLKDAKPSIEGSGGNHNAYRVASRVKDFGISKAMTLELMFEDWNARCQPPWDADELEQVIANAHAYGQSTPGTKSTIDPTSEFGEPVDPQWLEGIKPKKKKQASGLVTLNAHEVIPSNIKFIWDNRLGYGIHTCLAGVGGQGKSQIMYAIIAAITKGGQWPNNEGTAPKGYCVILSAEENPNDMIVPRLLAAGADLKFVKIISSVRDDKGNERKFNLQADLAKLEEYCKEIGNVILVGIDPVSSYMGGDLDSGKNVQVRHVLDPITQTAVKIGCSILSITHFNKGTSNKAVNKVMDSAAYVNAPRATFGVFEDPDDESACLVLLLKTNMKRVAGLRYKVGEKNIKKRDPDTGDPIYAPRVDWSVEPVTMTADDVVSRQNERETPELDRAIAFLTERLSNGPVDVKIINDGAFAEDLSVATMRRARRKLSVKAHALEGHMPAKWLYSIVDPDTEPTITDGAEDA